MESTSGAGTGFDGVLGRDDAERGLQAGVVMEYADFIKSKFVRVGNSGFDADASDINPKLYPWQREIVAWALRKGRKAVGIELKPEYFSTAVKNLKSLESEKARPSLLEAI